MTESFGEVITNEEQAVRAKADMKAADAVPAKRWRAQHASNVEWAAALANLEPAQGAGEAVFSVRQDGIVDVFLYF
jgi:hypothetical protein